MIKKRAIFSKIKNIVEKRKYEILLLSLLLLMFGTRPTFINLFLPLQVMVAGAIVFNSRGFLFYLIAGLLIFTVAISIYSQIFYFKDIKSHSLAGIAFIIYFIAVTLEVFRRIMISETVSTETISAVLCGFIMLGFIGWFVYNIIETYTPGSFSGIGDDESKLNNLLYFSVTNLLTLGLGDVLPITLQAKKSLMVMGFIGHFYTVFVTSIIIGKYIHQMDKKVE